jgi:hypothetical protein
MKHGHKIQSQEVFLRRPILGEIYQEFGNMSLAAYIKQWPVSSRIEQEFLEILTELTREIYGPEISVQVAKGLGERPLVSTIDHLGLWGHPIFLNADLMYSLAFSPDQTAVVLATESVSLNNTSSWSGSVLGHLSAEKMWRVSFFPDRQKTLPVWSVSALRPESWVKAGSRLEEVAKNQMEPVQAFIGEVIKSSHFFARPNFSEQACAYSTTAWQKKFPTAPRLVFLPLETAISRYIANVLKRSDHWLNILMSEEGWQAWLRFFPQERTKLFWEIDSRGRRQSLTRLPDGKQELLLKLEQRKIYPSSPLCFCVLLFCGLTAAGGFTQTTWLTQTKEKFLNFLSAYPNFRLEAERLDKIFTKNFAEGRLAEISLEGKSISPSLADLLVGGRKFEYPFFVEAAHKLSLKESIDKNMTEIYNIVVPKTLQSPQQK